MCVLFVDWDTLDIKEHLIDELDYTLVPTEGWKKLVSWYGLKDGQEPIARKVVEAGMFVKHCKVEVYLTELMLCEYNNMDNIVPRRFSKADTIALIEREMRKLFSVPDEKEARLWGKYMSNSWEPLNNLNSTIQDAGLYQGQSFQSLTAPPESTDSGNGNDNPSSSLFSFDGLRESVRQLRDKLEDFCKEEIKKISDRVTFTNTVPKTRNDFLQYSHLLTLDLNTMNKHLCLSESNRVIANTDKAQLYPDHPDRFDQWFQVFCRERVCGRCYWEIEWSGDVFISVSYKSIIRKGLGKECVFGRNAKSWSLICTPSRYSFIHNNIETELPEVSSHRIGVFVDPSAGTLSFYSISDTMSLIHTVQTTFTQPLYPGFRVGSGSSVKLC
ncbi:hypothetical protein cypCar_00040417 [Cyprinus carpio]|nr:hypothetical protein cypCar_00040417 [Cyprinus carpio]